LHAAAWGLCLALMLANRAMAEYEPDPAQQPHYTQDPIGDAFVGIFDNTAPEQVYYWPPLLLVVPIDINLDGRLDLLVSANYYRNGRQGEISQVFIREDQGYRDLRRPIAPGKSLSLIDFTYSAARVRPNPESRSVSFFDLNTGGGGFCTLYETRISGTTIEFRMIAELHAQDEEDRARIPSLQRLFEPLESRIRYMDFGYLQKRYAARLHREPLELERSMGGTPHKYVPIDYRGPVHAVNFLDSPEDAYALLDGTTNDTVPSDIERASEFKSVEIALEYYMKHNPPTWKPAPVEGLVEQFGEDAVIAILEPGVARYDRQERFFALNSLTEVVRRSTDPNVRQRFVEQILTGTLGEEELISERDWLNTFAASDFNTASREFLLHALTRTKDKNDSNWTEGRLVRWAGIANVEAAKPTLRKINGAQRDLKSNSHNPLFMRSALIALGRMGDPEAVREMIECIERVEDPKVRALSLQRLAILRSPEAVDYLKRYLFSDVEHPESSSDWLPVSEAQCAADTLRAMLENFPEGPLEAQRTWMEERMEFVFKPAGSENVFPGLGQ
jgi:hypothetical protein